MVLQQYLLRHQVKQAAPMCSTHVVSQLRPHETAFAPAPPIAVDPCYGSCYVLLRVLWLGKMWAVARQDMVGLPATTDITGPLSL